MPLPVDISALDQAVAIAVMAEDLKANDKVTVEIRGASRTSITRVHGRPGLPGGLSDDLTAAQQEIESQGRRIDRLLVELDIVVGAVLGGIVALVLAFIFHIA